MVGLGDLSGGTFHSEATGVSADGSVIVGTGMSSSGLEVFRWTEAGGMVGLGDLPGGTFYSIATGVSADGSVITGYSNSSSGTEAFLWDSENGMQSLRDILSANGIDMTDWSLNEAAAISADGLTITGFGINPDGNREAWVATVPEPATMSLLALGFVAMLRRRKK